MLGADSDPFDFDDDDVGASGKGRASHARTPSTRRAAVHSSASKRQSDVDHGDDEGGGGMQRLRFNRQIVSSAVKPISTIELVKRLKELHGKLAQLNQEDVDKSSLQQVRTDLVSRSLFMHKDKAVRILTACCLADILRLFAPDAPYRQSDLRDIFEFFLKQIHNITDTQGPYFENYFYLLESLSTVKSILLVTDINAEELITQIFRDFYELLRIRPDTQKNIYSFMLDILQQLVEESPRLNQEVIDIMMQSFTAKKTLMGIKYFGDLLVAAAKENVDTGELESAHSLILEINSCAKGVLLNVIPLLEEELRYDHAEIRLLATQVLGKMISEAGSNVAQSFPATFKAWLDRRHDKQANIRIQWLEFSLDIFRNHPDLAPEVEEQKLKDPDDKVRLTAVKLFSQMDLSAISSVPKDLLLHLYERCKDKKVNIRAEAFKALSRLYRILFDKMAENTQIEEKISWIPGHLLETLYIDEADIKVAVEKSLVEDIFPVNLDNDARTLRLLTIISNLDERQYAAFLTVIDRQAQTIKALTTFIEHCEKWNGGIMDTPDPSLEPLLNKIINFLTARLPDPLKSAAHLQNFAKANENRAYKLLLSIMDEKADYKSILKNNVEPIGVMETFSILLRRVSLTILGRSSIPALLQAAREAKSSADQSTPERLKAADKLIKDVASKLPGVFRSQITDLALILESDDKSLEGSQREAKNSSLLICKVALSSFREELIEEIVTSLTPKLIEAALKDEPSLDLSIAETVSAKDALSARLITLGQLARHASPDFERHHKPIINFVVKEIIMKNRSDADIHGDEDWVKWNDLGAEAIFKVSYNKAKRNSKIRLGVGLPYNKKVFKKLDESLGAENLKRSYLSKDWVTLRLKGTQGVKSKAPASKSNPASSRKTSKKEAEAKVAAKSGAKPKPGSKSKAKDGESDAEENDTAVPERRKSAPRSAKTKAQEKQRKYSSDSEIDDEENEEENGADSDVEMEDAEHDDDSNPGSPVAEKAKRKSRDDEMDEDDDDSLKKSTESRKANAGKNESADIAGTTEASPPKRAKVGRKPRQQEKVASDDRELLHCLK
ncbi:hypothetical protein HDU96_003456 [Phlyctochytrium bullatum]|nr:hypothetical protein HDU96_003456 [Phlyctochytrium bullatum]